VDVFWGILHRKIFMELLRVFLLALVALTGILLLGGIFAEATQRGLTPVQVLLAIPLLIPNTLPYTLPATTLFATCVVFGRLAHDNEILAIKAAGINVLHVVWPAGLLGLLASAATFALYLETIPNTHHMLRTRFVSDVEELLYSMLKRDGCIRHKNLGYVIFVKRVEGRKMIDAQFMRRDPKNQYYDVIARAREAELRVDMAQKQIIVHMRHCYISSENGLDEGYVLDKDWPVELPDFPTDKDRPSQFTWEELQEKLEEFKARESKFDEDIRLHEIAVNQGNAPKSFVDHVKNLRNKKKAIHQKHVNIVAEMNARPSLSLGCLCFVLVGCPVGIWFSKSDYLSAFITCFLPIVVMYYPLMLCGINMGRTGTIHPAFCIWAANALMTVTAFFLFRRLLKN
jgi:lipopolysaccharide export system permease protein